MQSFTVASRDCAFIASVQQAEKVRLEEEEKKKEAVGVGPFAELLRSNSCAQLLPLPHLRFSLAPLH
jgi:hypothetical protein